MDALQTWLQTHDKSYLLHRDSALVWLLQRMDKKGQGVACGGGYISPRKKCSKDKAKTTPKEALKKTTENRKKLHALKAEVQRDKGKKATKIEGKQRTKSAKSAQKTPDYTLADINASEDMLKKSLFKLLPPDQAATEWQRAKLESQFSDIHIEEL